MIIGVDPGKRTGIWIMHNDKLIYGYEKPALKALDIINRVSLHVPSNAIITYAVERYDIGPMTGKLSRQYEALEVIGAIKYFAHERGEYSRVIMQQRAAKKRVPDEVLKRLNWWTPGSEGDMHDAQRHALVCAASIAPWHDLVKRAFGTIS